MQPRVVMLSHISLLHRALFLFEESIQRERRKRPMTTKKDTQHTQYFWSRVMQKKLLVAAVSSLIAGQAMAATVYDDGTNKFEVGGHIGIRVQNQGTADTSDTTTTGDSSRFNLVASSKLNESTTAFATGEWGFDVTNTDSDTFSNRLGFVGAKNDQLGSLSIGKQWSTYSTVAAWTDMFATVGGEASGLYGEDDAAVGTGRADDALQYNLSMHGLNVSAQYQFADSKETTFVTDRQRKNAYALAVSYDLPMGLSFGVAHNEADFEKTTPELEKAKATLVGIKYAQGPIYAAATYSLMKNHATLDADMGYADVRFEKAIGTELYVSYELNENFKLETGYNELKNDEDSAGADVTNNHLKYFPVGVVYTAGPMQLSATYQYEKGTKNVVVNTVDTKKDVDDKFVVQARYYF